MKIGFYEVIFLWFGHTNQVIQNPIPNLDKTIISEKPGYLSGKLKTLTSSNYHKVKYFMKIFCTRFLLTISAKGSSVFFCFFLDLELFIKFLQITQDPEHPLVVIGKQETCAKFQQKNIKLYGSWSSSKFSVFQTKNLVSRKQ